MTKTRPTRIAGFRTAKALAFRAIRRNDCLGYDNAYEALRDARQYTGFCNFYDWNTKEDRAAVEIYLSHAAELRAAAKSRATS